MKRHLITSFVYLLLGAAAGVFYREFTKWNNYTGVTALGKMHPHLIALGCLLFLALYFGLKDETILKNKKYQAFYILFNIGLPGTVLMMLVRGITEVKAVALSKGGDLAISGIAGLFHVTLAAGLVCLFLALFDLEKAKKAQKVEK
jgi:hypothetical protein